MVLGEENNDLGILYWAKKAGLKKSCDSGECWSIQTRRYRAVRVEKEKHEYGSSIWHSARWMASTDSWFKLR